jgi:hypothetical protein
MGSSAAAARRRGKKAPICGGTEVVINASSSAKVVLKMPSVARTKMKVIARELSRRVSRVNMRSKFASVKPVTFSVRPMSVNARNRSMMTGDDEEDEEEDQRGSEEQREIGPLTSKLGACEIGHGEPPSLRIRYSLSSRRAPGPSEPVVPAQAGDPVAFGERHWVPAVRGNVRACLVSRERSVLCRVRC